MLISFCAHCCAFLCRIMFKNPFSFLGCLQNGIHIECSGMSSLLSVSSKTYLNSNQLSKYAQHKVSKCSLLAQMFCSVLFKLKQVFPLVILTKVCSVIPTKVPVSFTCRSNVLGAKSTLYSRMRLSSCTLETVQRALMPALRYIFLIILWHC